MLTIKKYLSADKNSQVVNIKTLLLQSAAFLLFLVSITVFGVAYTLYTVTEGNNDFFYKFFFVSEIALQTCSFLSQCLICVIFTQLSEKQRV